LLIGIDGYEDENIPDLSWARADAETLSALLIDPLYCNIPSQNVTTLVDREATKKNVIRCLGKLRDEVQSDDTVIIHFSGHGCSVDDPSRGDPDDQLLKYLAPYDARLDHLDASAIAFDSLRDDLQRIRARRMLVMLDCCYAGAIVEGRRTFSVPEVVRARAAAPISLAFLQSISGVGRVTVSACSGEEVARESSDLRHGIFSHCLIEGLKGAADFRNDGLVGFNELWTYLADETVRTSEERQHPVMSGTLEGPSLILSRPRTLTLSPEQKKDLEYRLAIKYGKHGLQTVRVADEPSAPAAYDDAMDAIAQEAARYLDDELTHNQRIAVTCGRTLHKTITQLSRKNWVNVEIFPLNAYISEEVEIIDSNVLTGLLRATFSGRNVHASLLPTGVPSEIVTRHRPVFEKRARKIFRAAKDSHIFLLGIGGLADPNANVASVLRKAGLTPDQLAQLGAVGEVNFQLFDKDGRFLISKAGQAKHLQRYYEQFFAFSAKDLEKVARKSGPNLIAIVGGVDKREAVLGAIKGGLVRTLITDTRTAIWLSRA